MKFLLLFLCLKLVIGKEDNIKDELIRILEGSKPDGKEIGTVEVETIVGNISGKKIINKDGDEVHMFLGIPYAQPPVKNLRFLPPRPMLSYENFEAFEYGPLCPQVNYFNNFSMAGEEDCLHLNIYSKYTDSTNLKPVMFWIHGGGFVMGSGSSYDPTPLIKEDVLVVTINYRLAALGFLTMGNDLAPGNLGLRDQILALTWVKTLIHHFGGDPTRVTIFGESAGGMSSHALTMSPKAYDLFSAAIFESGTMLAVKEKYGYSRTHRGSLAVADYFNCSSSSYDQEMLGCLQNIPFTALLGATSTPGFGALTSHVGFMPVIDTYSNDPVLPVDYLTAMKTGYFNKVPIMTGTVQNEGALLLNTMPNEITEEFWNAKGTASLFMRPSFNTTELREEEILQANMMKRFYLGKENVDVSESALYISDMINDALFLSPDQIVSEYASKYVPVFNYRFDYAETGSYSLLPFFITGKEDMYDEATQNALKPVHGDELFYLFKMGDLSLGNDLQMRDIMVRYWTNFAKYGNPSPVMSDEMTQWLTYSSEKRYLNLNLKPEMKKEVELERMEFWRRVFWNEREEEMQEQIESGDNEFLKKPFSSEMVMKPFNPDVNRLFSGH